MGAKITVAGQARDVHRTDNAVSFYIVTGPPTRHPPRGLKLFGPVRYVIECTTRQWRRARHNPNDQSDLIVEGYLEPRRDLETGQLYVAVVATSIQSTLVQNHRKLNQLTEVLEEARKEYKRAREGNCSLDVLEQKAAAFVKANDSVQSFLQKHPELLKPSAE